MLKITRDEFNRLVVFMRENYGINLEQQLPLVETRLEPMMRIRGFTSLGEYLTYMMNDKTHEEPKMLVTKLTTNFTYFMREAQHYKYLQQTVLPELRNTVTGKDIRTWSAGCSSGEEAYTMAMVFDDFFGPAKKEWDTTVLATDISPAVLQTAKQGVYPADRFSKLSPQWQAKYFRKLDAGRFQLTDAMRKEVALQMFNLMDTFPFKKKFHIIFCRNVMIYFNPKTCNEVIGRFYNHLEPGGHLIVGMSETINLTANPRFKFVQPSIYRK